MTTNLHEYRNFIGGAFLDGAAGTFDDIDPATGGISAGASPRSSGTWRTSEATSQTTTGGSTIMATA